jgi:hypothetical protein
MAKDDEVQFPEKWAKILKNIPEFKDTADAADSVELKKIIIQSEGNISVIEREKSADMKINAAKEIVKEHSAPYRDAMKVQMAKIKYALFLLEGRGEDLDSREE